MAKFEITLTGDRWTDKTSEPNDEPFKAALLRLDLVDVEVDLDEVDHTITDTKWDVSVYAEFECADNEVDTIAKKAGAALEAAGLRNVTWDMEEEDYPMPEHEILEVFRDTVLPNLAHKDRTAIRLAFHDHVDSLQKRNMITEWQAEHITNPWSRS